MDKLLAIAEGLARPYLYLSEALPGETVAGVWGGRAAIQTAGTQRAHWVSISCDWLRARGFPVEGWLSIYTSSATEREW